ncbi:MAG: hypothetical protein JO003_10745 [Candidatus Eremiobacteraeota bacterium]|nr:hypothetical protein [Candidatus Eremiobacteraeota bacterium]
MKRRLRGAAVAAAASFCAVVLCGIPAPAAVDLSVGIRHVSPDGSAQECSEKARTALSAFLQNASESSAGSGEWIASGQNPRAGAVTAAATVRCYPLAKGYVVTFTCAVQLPDNPYGADALCLDVAHKFYGGAIAPLAAMPQPTPVPTGCSTVNLVGTWVADDKPGLTLTADLNGNMTDNEGVSGNWGLKGTTVTLTYYGEHTLTLSSDGKHMRGGGYSFTRRC